MVKAIMKAVNITLQHTPEIHKAEPPCLNFWIKLLPCIKGKITKSDTSVKKLRQKVTSKLLACSRCRVTTPAIDHIMVQTTIKRTAWRWVSFMATSITRATLTSQIFILKKGGMHFMHAAFLGSI
jgi:hypothetical protein